MTAAAGKRFTAKGARQTLLAAWFGFFVVNVALLLYLYLDNWIFEDNFRAGLSQLSALYAPYLGGILGYYFSVRAKKPADLGDPGTAFFLAGLASAIWNLAILGILLRVVLLWGTVEQSVRDMMFFGSTLSWLVAPAIGYWFASSTATRTRGKHES